MTGIIAQIQLQSQQVPDRIAVRSGDEAISFGDLEGASNRLARSLIAEGHTGCIAHFGPGGPSQAISFLAAQKAGLAFTALDDSLPANMLKDRMEVAGVRTLTTDASRLKTAHFFGPDVIEVQHDRLSDPIERHITPETISHIRFTSGSTGRSRGVCLTHGHVDRMTGVFERFLKADRNDQYALLGQFWPMVMLRAMSVGATLHDINPTRIGLNDTRERLLGARINALFAYPQAIRSTLGTGARLSDLRYLHVSGGALSASDLCLFRHAFAEGTIVHASFGSTEFPWIAAALHTVGTSLTHTPPPVGIPIFPAEVCLRREDGTRCAVGETGQIVVRSHDLPDGYLNDPASTRRHFFVRDGVPEFRTGDMAYADENGVWHGRGRVDDIFNVRGANVWPADVERTLEMHPAVREAALAPARGANGETSLAAMVVADKDIDAAALRSFLRARLPGPMVPSRITQVADLPKTETGKLVRSRLPETTVTPIKTTPRESPKGKTETVIASIWVRMLGIAEPDRHADFFDIGGDSLMAMEMLARVETAFGRRIPIDILALEGGSIAALANWLEKDSAGSDPVRLRAGDAPTLLVFPVAGGHLSDYLRLIEIYPGTQEIIGLRPAGLSPGDTSATDMADLAASMLRNAQFGNMPPDLLGYSFGALAAYEAACQMTAAGQSIGNLVLIDPPMDWQSHFPMARYAFHCLRARDYSGVIGLSRALSRTLPAHRKIDAAHARAALRFRPKPLTGVRTLLILSDQSRRLSVEPVWSSLLGHHCEVRSVPARHTELLRVPAVDQTAQMIADWLTL